MDIRRATEITLSALTVKEKDLARDLIFSEQYDKKTKSAWIRAPVLNLSEALGKARSGASQAGFRAQFFSFFCDTLEISSGTEILPEQDGAQSFSFEIDLYARKLDYSLASDSPAFHIHFGKNDEFWLWTAKLPESFRISFDGQGTSRQMFTPRIDSDHFGVILRLEKAANSVSVESLPAPDGAMTNIDYLKLIGEDGKLQSKGYLNDDLPRLLQFQMLVAQTSIALDRGLAVELLSFVAAASANSQAAALHCRATALLSSLLIETNVVAVPPVNVYGSKQILKSRLIAALAFEEAFRDFSLEAGNRKVQSNTAIDLLRKSQDAIETYSFLTEIRQKEYDNAISANTKAQHTFQENQDSLQSLGTAFQAGIDEWKEAQKEQAAKEILKGIIMVGIAIGATVATGGAAAPAVVPAAASAVSTVGKVATLIAKLKKIFDQIKKIYEKIKPVIEKLQQVVQTISRVVATLRKFEHTTGGTTNLKLSADSSDIFNATAEWKRFDITVREMEDSLKEYQIKGKEDYFHALKTLVPNGECLILTQANLVRTGDELTTVLVQGRAEKNDTARLSATAFNVATDLSVLNLLVRAMFDRILTIRTLVFLDFYTYAAAHAFFTFSQDPVVSLSPVKPVVDYLEDVAKLQGSLVAFGSQVLVQQRVFAFKSLAGHKDSKSLAAAVVSRQPLTFTVNPNLDIFRNFGRIRLSRARCYLEGAELSSAVPADDRSLPLRIELQTESQFFDLPIQRLQQKDEPPFPRVFLGASRKIVFEYRLHDQSVTCDGWYGQERDYTKLTPMTTWTARVIDNEPGTLSMSSVDMANFKGISMEFLCDFSLPG